VACSASTLITTWLIASRSAAATQSWDPQRQARVASRRANGPTASARRCAVVRGSFSHTVAANASSAASSSAASVACTLAQIAAIPAMVSPISMKRLSSILGGTRTPSGSYLATHKSTRSRSFGVDSRIHFPQCRAIAASTAALRSGSTLSVRAMMVATIR
jgi:hypothetical protein